jgi:hypothetical protein
MRDEGVFLFLRMREQTPKGKGTLEYSRVIGTDGVFLTVTHSVNGFLQIQELEFNNHDDTVIGLAQIFLRVARNLMAGLQCWKNQI